LAVKSYFQGRLSQKAEENRPAFKKSSYWKSAGTFFSISLKIKIKKEKNGTSQNVSHEAKYTYTSEDAS
jgi:hypothetical protein